MEEIMFPNSEFYEEYELRSRSSENGENKTLRRRRRHGRQFPCVSHISAYFVSKGTVGLSSELYF